MDEKGFTQYLILAQSHYNSRNSRAHIALYGEGASNGSHLDQSASRRIDIATINVYYC